MMRIIAEILEHDIFIGDCFSHSLSLSLSLSLVFATLMIRTSLDIANRVPSAPVKKLDSTI